MKSWTLGHLDVIGFASKLVDPVLPRVLPPVLRDRTQPDLYLLPPFTVVGDEVFNAGVSNAAEVELLVKREQVSLLPTPVPGRVNHDLWVDPNGTVQYQPKSQVKAAFASLFQEHLSRAASALANPDLDRAKVTRDGEIAHAVDPHHLDPLVIRGAIEQRAGDSVAFSFTRFLATSYVSPEDFDHLVAARREKHDSATLFAQDSNIAGFAAVQGQGDDGSPTTFGMKRLWLNVGRMDQIQPQDIVGCILDETGLPSATVGRIQLFERHTLVDISAAFESKILEALNHAAVRGRKLKAKIAAY